MTESQLEINLVEFAETTMDPAEDSLVDVSEEAAETVGSEEAAETVESSKLDRLLKEQQEDLLMRDLLETDKKHKAAEKDRAVLEVVDLRKDYGSRSILKGLTFDVRVGQIIGVLGMNAAGKTTLFKSLLGTTPFQGSVRIDGMPFNSSATSILWVPNGFEDDQTVADNLRYYYALYGKPWDQYQARNLISEFGIGSTWSLSFKFLSTGQRRKLAIMRTFIKQNVSVYLMDEPTSGLDIPSCQTFIAILKRRLKKNKSCALMITHNRGDLEEHVDKILVLNEGRILDFGTLEELTERHMKGYLLRAVYPPEDEVTHLLLTIFKEYGIYYSLQQGTQMNSLYAKIPDLHGFEKTYRQITKFFSHVSLQKQNLSVFIELTLSGRKFGRD